MSKSKDSAVLTRREALLLSTTAGLGAALSKPAFGSDSVKTAAHQDPGNVSTSRSAVAIQLNDGAQNTATQCNRIPKRFSRATSRPLLSQRSTWLADDGR